LLVAEVRETLEDALNNAEDHPLCIHEWKGSLIAVLKIQQFASAGNIRTFVDNKDATGLSRLPMGIRLRIQQDTRPHGAKRDFESGSRNGLLQSDTL
jgi:hypothetical protein